MHQVIRMVCLAASAEFIHMIGRILHNYINRYFPEDVDELEIMENGEQRIIDYFNEDIREDLQIPYDSNTSADLYDM